MINIEQLNQKNSIIFIDIDETLFRTFAKIYVIKNNKIMKKLDNKEFNSYVLGDGESFDFHEFADGKLFKETSIPISQTMKKLKHLINKIKEINNSCIGGNCSKIIFLTAREDFFDKDNFLEAFRNQGIDIDNKELMYIERAGNLKGSSVAEKKNKIIMKYLSSGLYDFVQIIDDDEKNINILKEIANNFPRELLEKIKLNKAKSESEVKLEIKSNMNEEEIISFQGLLVDDVGNLNIVFEKSVKESQNINDNNDEYLPIIHKIIAIVIKDNKLLMVRKKGKDIWTGLGGKREDGESEEEALLREIKEEINCGAKIIRKLGDSESKAVFDDAIVKLSAYLVKLEGDIFLDDPELAEYIFMPENYEELGIKLPLSMVEQRIPQLINEGLLNWKKRV